MASLKESTAREQKLAPGHRACAGCIPALTFHQVLRSAPGQVIASCATGCIEVVTTIFPYTAWNIPFIHNAFENSAATMSGVEAAYKSLVKQGKMKDRRSWSAKAFLYCPEKINSGSTRISIALPWRR